MSASTPRPGDRVFVTVGAQMPFDRLVGAVDTWAGTHPEVTVVAQIGEGATPPRHLRHVPLLTPAEFRAEVAAADLVVSHAGMGTIITCLDLARPLVVFPRRGDRRETRNDHQVATAERLAGRPGIHVALESDELVELLDRRRDLARDLHADPPRTSPRLLAAIREVCDA